MGQAVLVQVAKKALFLSPAPSMGQAALARAAQKAIFRSLVRCRAAPAPAAFRTTSRPAASPMRQAISNQGRKQPLLPHSPAEGIMNRQYGMLYTAKGTAVVLVPLGNVL